MGNKKRSKEGTVFLITVLTATIMTYSLCDVSMIIAVIIGALFMIVYYALVETESQGSERHVAETRSAMCNAEAEYCRKVSAAVGKRFPGIRWCFIDKAHIYLFLGGRRQKASLVISHDELTIRIQKPKNHISVAVWQQTMADWLSEPENRQWMDASIDGQSEEIDLAEKRLCAAARKALCQLLAADNIDAQPIPKTQKIRVSQKVTGA